MYAKTLLINGQLFYALADGIHRSIFQKYCFVVFMWQVPKNGTFWSKTEIEFEMENRNEGE